MRIKQIELTGFKSFMDRTVLELPAGVTAIVGPNGCGKSNVVDAIRWVLGEQSPKHLRGGAMEDVIFAGNADQGPLGMAEASLLLERTDEDLARAAETSDELPIGPESLPPELAQASEIMVTRRYFRSGDSEYFINKAPCRLKDITELFLGTGVGTQCLRDHRAGPGRADRQREAGRPPVVPRGGRRHHALPLPAGSPRSARWSARATT